MVLSALSVITSVNSAQAATPTILVYGDSLSAAYGIPREQGWVTLLQQRLQKQKFPHQIINASVSGETTSSGLSRISSTLKQHKPNFILIELGANDGLRGLPISNMRHNLSAMIEASKQAGAKVFLIGIMIPPNYGPRYTADFKDSYTELALRFKLPLVPFLLDGVAGQRHLIQDDGLHPTAAAQGLVLENVWKVLGAELIKTQAKPAKNKP